MPLFKLLQHILDNLTRQNILSHVVILNFEYGRSDSGTTEEKHEGHKKQEYQDGSKACKGIMGQRIQIQA